MASTYLNRTPASSGNRKTWTWSSWVKKSTIGSGYQFLFSCTDASTSTGSIGTNYNGDNKIYFRDDLLSLNLTPSAVHRDTSAWYHIVVALDTTQSTASDRAKMWINGEQVTSFSTATYPSQNADGSINLVSGSYVHRIGTYSGSSNFFDGSMAHVHFTDGTAYAASDFGETDSTTGIWKPKTAPSVTYGTNGFFLKFANSGSMGTDSSGNSNTFTVNGNLTQTQDTPANVFATLNPLDKGYTGAIVLSNGNTTTEVSSGAGDYGLRSTLGVTAGKYYFEGKIVTSNTLVIGDMDARLVINMNDGSPTADFYGVQRYSDSTTNIYDDGTFTQNSSTMWGGITSSDIISFAVDLDNGKIFLAKNGTYKDQSGNTGDPAAGTNPTFTISDTTKTYGFYTELRGNDADGTQINFGNGYFGTTAVSSAQSPSDGIGLFEYSVPSGYKALCTKSINSQEYS